MECECCRRESVVLRFTTHWYLLLVPKGSLWQRWDRLAVQHRRFPIPVASRDTLCPPPPRAKEAELPTAKGEGGGPGVSVGGMVGVVSGGGVVGCPCGLGLARRRQLALISMFAYVSQRQNGPLRRTKYPCARFRTSSTRGDRWGPPNVLPNKDILNPIPVPIRMYTVHPYWRIYPSGSNSAALFEFAGSARGE